MHASGTCLCVKKSLCFSSLHDNVVGQNSEAENQRSITFLMIQLALKSAINIHSKVKAFEHNLSYHFFDRTIQSKCWAQIAGNKGRKVDLIMHNTDFFLFFFFLAENSFVWL